MRALLAVLLAAPAGAVFRPTPLPAPRAPLVSPVVPIIPAAPTLSLPRLSPTAAMPFAPFVSPAPALPVPAVAPRSIAAAVSEFAARLGDVAKGPSASAASLDAAAAFDGLRVPHAVAAGAVPASWPSDFERGTLATRDGARLSYGLRRPDEVTGAARVFVGGLALPESFLTYLESGPSGRADYALTLRGLPGSPWTHAKALYDADAFDLARMVVTAAQDSPAGRVELALHSYGTLVFQRMLQLRGDVEVDRALAALRGGRVVMFQPTTHYGDSETVVGPDFAETTRRVRLLVQWLDAGDSVVESWRAAARLNPALWVQAETVAASWRLQRETTLALAAKPVSDVLLQHLSGPWGPELEPARRRLLAETRAAARLPGWQEAALRRVDGPSQLEFTAADMDALRAAGVRLDLVLSRGDQLIPWATQRLLPGLAGIELPGRPPAAGTVYRDASGLVRVLIADGDHYLPLKDPAQARAILE